MRKIFLLITTIMVLGACEKESLLDEVRNYLEVEKAKINQDSLSAIVQGEWHAVDEDNHTRLIFSSNPKNFKETSLSGPIEPEDYYFNVDDYFFIKLDTFPNIYSIVAQHDRYGENTPDSYAVIKITKEFIFYEQVMLREGESKEILYKCIIANRLLSTSGNPSEFGDNDKYKKVK